MDLLSPSFCILIFIDCVLRFHLVFRFFFGSFFLSGWIYVKYSFDRSAREYYFRFRKISAFETVGLRSSNVSAWVPFFLSTKRMAKSEILMGGLVTVNAEDLIEMPINRQKQRPSPWDGRDIDSCSDDRERLWKDGLTYIMILYNSLLIHNCSTWSWFLICSTLRML